LFTHLIAPVAVLGPTYCPTFLPSPFSARAIWYMLNGQSGDGKSKNHELLRAYILLAKKGPASPSRAENVAAWVEWMVAQDPAHESKETTLNEHTIVSALELCHRCKDTHSAFRIARAMAFDVDDSQGPTGMHKQRH
jgi:hypothetical protein